MSEKNKKTFIKATHAGFIYPHTRELPCYVLENKKRVLSQTGMIKSLGMTSGGGSESGVPKLVSFLGSETLKPFISKALSACIQDSIEFIPPHGGRSAHGYEATLLVDICSAILDARNAKALSNQQEHIAIQCEILLRTFAKVGIIALVDEATGFQEERAKDDLRIIFGEILLKEAADYTKKFEKEFFDMLYKIHSLNRNPIHPNRHPQFFGNFINKYIYKPLDIIFSENRIQSYGVVYEILDDRNPVIYEKGGRKYRFHQFIEGVTLEKFIDHLKAVTLLGKISPNKRKFEENFARAFHIPHTEDLFDMET